METNTSEASKGSKVSLNSIESLFSDSYKLYQERFTTLSEIVLLPALFLLLGYIFQSLGFPFSIISALALVIGYIILVFSSLALIFSIHNNAGVDASYRASLRFFWPYVWIAILSSLALMGTAIMLVIPAIWLAILFTLKSYTLVIENRRGMDSLRQSKDYVTGYWWAVFGRALLFGIIIGIGSIIIRLPFGILGVPLISSIVQSIIIVVTVPFSSIFFYKIFENLRTIKPELHDAPASGNTFIKVSAIIGIFVWILLIVSIGLLVMAYRHGDFNQYMDQQVQTQNMPYSMVPSNQLNNY